MPRGTRHAMTRTPLTPAASLVTISYRGDLELARDLCASVDAFLDPAIEHVLVVPRSDKRLFAPLASPRRRIVLVEDVLPRDYHKLPLPRRINLGLFQRRLREMWWTPRGLTRGWIIQQILKLSAPEYVRSPTIVFADSDIVLVAPLTADRVASEGATRLYAVPDATADSAMHAAWHRTAQRLLGLPVTGYSGADYIGNLITWHAQSVLALQARIAETTGRRWDVAVLGEHEFSEYILYGVFTQAVLHGAGHRPSAEDLVHAGWFYDLSSEGGIRAFVEGVSGAPVGVAIQSTEHFTVEERRDIVRRVAAQLDE
jgi:hypothetical protein